MTPGKAAQSMIVVPRDERLPLSFAQQRLPDQMESGSVEYNVPMPFRFHGKADVR